MRQISSLSSLRRQLEKFRTKKESIGFVPTMGALHDGHLSLIRRSRRENRRTVLSIYVNPIQFDAKKEDFSSYPRPKKKDILLAKKENVDIIFLPTDRVMYPKGFSSFIATTGLTDTLCGKSRPGHFRGVTTVVGKLLNMVQPTRIYLGQKDAQQAIVINRMMEDLNFPVKAVICPTVREADGLAMSSRNAYLSPQHRREAPFLYKSLADARRRIRAGERKAAVIKRFIRGSISAHTGGAIDYVECVDLQSLKPVTYLSGKVLIAIAVKFAKARLIDNVIVQLR
ncbi:MAG: pantoate--beta-alanine ligase [Candidatus Omnitrophica bacterium]|nr:pantoate--beta-alanine ligase [Candidatus Omnitrophota bacterium]MCB9721818.1 pantoate--beta-alanine ligase [Candidatus Omnitrophota bacterium]